MEYRVCRNNPAPYNDLSGKISLLGLGTMRLPPVSYTHLTLPTTERV